MATFDRVIVIYNPKSTGNAQSLAEGFRDDLAHRRPGLEVELQPTEHAGHAADLARAAAAHGAPLLVSASGDGGYSELINGAMSTASNEWVAAVLPAGNANDHRRATKERPLVEAVLAGEVVKLDLLRMTTPQDGHVRFAHSYIGLGLTPVVAVELEKKGKGSLREVVTTIRTFARYQPFEIELESGRRKQFNSLVFANIAEMAKIATLSDATGRPDDGKFEVITLDHRSKWRTMVAAVKAGTVGLGAQPSVAAYTFTTVKPTPIQVDGEITHLEAGVPVQITLAAQALRTLL